MANSKSSLLGSPGLGTVRTFHRDRPSCAPDQYVRADPEHGKCASPDARVLALLTKTHSIIILDQSGGGGHQKSDVEVPFLSFVEIISAFKLCILHAALTCLASVANPQPCDPFHIIS